MGKLAERVRQTRRVAHEYFFRSAALRAARERPPSDERRRRILAADRRRAAALLQNAPGQLPAALELMREALSVLAEAAEPRDPGGRPSSVLSAMHAADVGLHRAKPAALERVLESFADPRALAFDELRSSAAQDLLADADEVYEWARRHVAARSVGELQLSRVVRLGAFAVAATLVVGLTVGRVVKPHNRALNRPVQMSSRRANTPPASGPAGLDPAGLVDGKKGDTYDVCTNNEVHPWVMVDLAQSARIGTVKVYNRGDCCWGAYDLPQVLEVSNDGKQFETVARRTEAYTAAAPWEIELAGRTARYVRVRADAAEPRELVLTELEVFSAR